MEQSPVELLSALGEALTRKPSFTSSAAGKRCIYTALLSQRDSSDPDEIILATMLKLHATGSSELSRAVAEVAQSLCYSELPGATQIIALLCWLYNGSSERPSRCAALMNSVNCHEAFGSTAANKAEAHVDRPTWPLKHNESAYRRAELFQVDSLLEADMSSPQDRMQVYIQNCKQPFSQQPDQPRTDAKSQRTAAMDLTLSTQRRSAFYITTMGRDAFMTVYEHNFAPEAGLLGRIPTVAELHSLTCRLLQTQISLKRILATPLLPSQRALIAAAYVSHEHVQSLEQKSSAWSRSHVGIGMLGVTRYVSAVVDEFQEMLLNLEDQRASSALSILSYTRLKRKQLANVDAFTDFVECECDSEAALYSTLCRHVDLHPFNACGKELVLAFLFPHLGELLTCALTDDDRVVTPAWLPAKSKVLIERCTCTVRLMRSVCPDDAYFYEKPLQLPVPVRCTAASYRDEIEKRNRYLSRILKRAIQHPEFARTPKGGELPLPEDVVTELLDNILFSVEAYLAKAIMKKLLDVGILRNAFQEFHRYVLYGDANFVSLLCRQLLQMRRLLLDADSDTQARLISDTYAETMDLITLDQGELAPSATAQLWVGSAADLNTSRPESLYDVISRVKVAVNAVTPLAHLFDDATLARYSAIFRQILRVHICSETLSALTCRVKGFESAQADQIYRIRMHMQPLVNNLRAIFFDQVIVRAYADLLRGMECCESFFELQQLHDRFIDEARKWSFSEDLGNPVCDSLRNALDTLSSAEDLIDDCCEEEVVASRLEDITLQSALSMILLCERLSQWADHYHCEELLLRIDPGGYYSSMYVRRDT